MFNKPFMFAALTAAALASGPALAEDVVKHQSTSAMEDVVFNLENAIINRGFVVDHHSFISEMLDRTADDVGAGQTVYTGAEVLQFCSAVVSRAAMEANPDNIAYCPYSIFVYETKVNPGVVQVGYESLPAGEGRDAVNQLLEEIATEAVEQ